MSGSTFQWVFQAAGLPLDWTGAGEISFDDTGADAEFRMLRVAKMMANAKGQRVVFRGSEFPGVLGVSPDAAGPR